MLVPLYGFLEGDTLGLLVLAHDDMRIAEVGEQLRAAASLRAGWTGPARVEHDGIVLDDALSVAQSGLRSLDRIDVRRRSAP